MAQRRMFSLQIVDSDAFLDMPPTSQLLYFHLAMRADDDGFISNHKKIMRTTNATDDDFKILLAKNFIIPFESGICVIKHWRMHNYIQKDRYHKTPYVEEFAKLSIKDNDVYTLDTKCTQNVHKMDTEVSLELGQSKARVSQELVEDSLEPSAPTPADEAKDFFQNEEKQKMLIDALSQRGYSVEFSKAELSKFIGYWTEKTPNGKKQRWQTEKTFEIKRRLITWFDKSNLRISNKQQETKGITI